MNIKNIKKGDLITVGRDPIDYLRKVVSVDVSWGMVMVDSPVGKYNVNINRISRVYRKVA